MKEKGDANEDARVRYRRQSALGLGYMLVGGMLVFTGLGFWIDKKRDSAPLWTVVGMFLGLLYGGYEVWKLARLYEDGDKPAPDPSEEDSGKSP